MLWAGGAERYTTSLTLRRSSCTGTGVPVVIINTKAVNRNTREEISGSVRSGMFGCCCFPHAGGIVLVAAHSGLQPLQGFLSFLLCWLSCSGMGSSSPDQGSNLLSPALEDALFNNIKEVPEWKLFKATCQAARGVMAVSNQETD